MPLTFMKVQKYGISKFFFQKHTNMYYLKTQRIEIFHILVRLQQNPQIFFVGSERVKEKKLH